MLIKSGREVKMNLNSENPIYLIASISKNTDRLVISGIGIYEKHKLTKSIDLKFDSDGNLIPFDSSEKGSHMLTIGLKILQEY